MAGAFGGRADGRRAVANGGSGDRLADAAEPAGSYADAHDLGPHGSLRFDDRGIAADDGDRAAAGGGRGHPDGFRIARNAPWSWPNPRRATLKGFFPLCIGPPSEMRFRNSSNAWPK